MEKISNCHGFACALAVFAALSANAAFIAVDGDVPLGTDGTSDTARFVRTVEAAKPVKKATWTVSGLGIFRAYVNGREVGADDFLKPGLTHILKRRHSFAYDVTPLLKQGKNVLAAEVSTGWWRDAVVKHPGVKPAKESGFGGTLEITYHDGTSESVPTDARWQASYGGNLVHAEIYWGETYDARADFSWRTTGNVDWPTAKIHDGFKGVVTPVEGRTIKVRRDLALKPQAMYVWRGAEGASEEAFGKANILRRPADGKRILLDVGETLVVDFGQNAAGVLEVVATAASGVELYAHPAEMLNDMNGEKSRGNDGPAGSAYIANYRTARTTMTYIFAGTGEEKYMPTFTFFGGRYLSFTANGKVALSSVRFLPVMSIAPEDETGTIATGHEDVNRLISNCVWGMRSNYLSVPTDCPQRSERLGWSGDTQAFVGAAVYAADVYGFLSKWMTDMRDSQMGDDEKFPGSFRRVAPIGPAGFRGYMIGWSDAGVIVPYTLWRQFGDTSAVKANWTAMICFMELLNRTNYVTPPEDDQCADWLAPAPYERWRRNNSRGQLKKPRWDGETEADMRQYWDMLGACYHIWDLRMMGEMARAIGKDGAAKTFAAREKSAVMRYRDLFLDHRGRLADRYRDMQTPILYPLWLGLFPSEEATAAAKEDLVANLKRGGFKIGTGFLGTPILLDVLADVVGEPELAYSVLLQHGCPGWLYSVDQGATTIWERWDGYTKERGFGPVSMNSFNHYAYGAVMGWMYRTMAGIRPGEKGGYEKFVLSPKPDSRVGSCTASYRTKYGVIRSSWRYGDDGKLSWSFTVPPGTTAKVVPPDGGTARTYAPGTYDLQF